ncbi:uncharacterized protein SCODWIG_03459 [Saccharomycodes ludwigii]|uniref:Uncharacterized protein n=1 Tax=Saccharomycodes ludwigii TaxID=36035 RepID=A0A376BAH2_9ASCO|nr:hypothetical protein SCDLUD_004933 [Saccharomycodes ludwigii]KAH3899488.1 hypothetical protein SCDLUD_004933 [Saccharomycodes ludwigii]SSD61698.1 uncharacterized protein SCODWIG_03459 [Saccharomycodes ludwigii]
MSKRSNANSNSNVYTALSQITVSVWSSDKNLIQSNEIIRVHPACKISKILQYVHFLLKSTKRTDNDLCNVNAYCLLYKQKVLDLNSTIGTIKDPETSIFSLEFELDTNKANNDNGHPQIKFLSYSPQDFVVNNIKVECQINTLSSYKILNFDPIEISLNCNFSGLAKKCLNKINEFEITGSSTGTFCLNGHHTIDDIMSFNFAGKTFTDPLSVIDQRLCDILGYDLIPTDKPFVLLLFIRHKQRESKIALEFISDSELMMNQMNINENTTISDVKNFLCSVYAHATRINSKDIKLIYQGQLLDCEKEPKKKILSTITHNADSNIIREEDGTMHFKIHVSINTDGFFRYDENEPGFWTELFHNPNRFSFMNRGVNAPTPENATGRINKRENVVSNSNIVINNGTTDLSPEEYEFYTEEGDQVHRTCESYEKVYIKGSPYFIRRREFDTYNYALNVRCNVEGGEEEEEEEEDTISIDREDFRQIDNCIFLSSRVINTINDKFGVVIEKQQIVEQDDEGQLFGESGSLVINQNNNNASTNVNPLLQETRLVSRIKEFIRIFARSIYLMFRNSILGIIILTTLSSFIPVKYTIALLLINFLRALWFTNEVWDMWILFFTRNTPLGDKDYNRFRKFIVTGTIPKELRSKLKRNCIVRTILAQTLRESPELQKKIIREYLPHMHNIDNGNVITDTDQLESLVSEILENSTKNKYDELPQPDLQELFQPFFQWLNDKVENSWKNEYPTDENEGCILNTIRNYLRPLRVFVNILQRISNFLNEGIVLYFSTDTETDNFFVGILKTIVLFFLLFWPGYVMVFNRMIRASDLERERRLRREALEDNNEHAPVEQLEDNAVENVVMDEIMAEEEYEHLDSNNNEGNDNFELIEEIDGATGSVRR